MTDLLDRSTAPTGDQAPDLADAPITITQRNEVEMSPAEFLADVEVAVRNRNVAPPRTQRRFAVGVDGDAELVAATATAARS